jgi:monothiol glutaredoxin
MNNLKIFKRFSKVFSNAEPKISFKFINLSSKFSIPAMTFCTSNNNAPKNETEDIHSDFKPKIKVDINNENVMKVIDDWVKNNNAVLFMKGNREMPRCGFSNYVVQIMNFYKIKNLKVINILENPLVRESVKQYSNWPTYPQFYVKGNLIGGCDILKEMHENGTLKELVEREGLASE